MAEPFGVGLDFGSLGCRAVCAAGPVIVPVALPAEWTEPARWLVVESAPDSIPGVRFSSVKSLLAADSRSTAIAREFLLTLRKLAPQPAGHLVIAVPALYSTSRRSALLGLAREAGFAGVHLLNDGMAAALSQPRPDDAAQTVLAFNCGYSGFEAALIRVARGHYRALAYHGSEAVSGSVFDAIILDGCLRELARHNQWPPAKPMPPEDWMAFRLAVQQVKEAMPTGGQAVLQVQLGFGARSRKLRLRVSGQEFERAVEEILSQGLASLDTVLKEANLEASDVNQVLLAGGVTHMPAVARAVASRFPRTAIQLPGDGLARGAAIYAAQLGLVHTTEAPPVAAPDRQPGRTPLVTVELILPGAGPAEAPAERSPAALALDRARRLLSDGKFPDAVRRAHDAYELEPDDPAVFRGMIDIHCQAAMAWHEPDTYEDSIRLLMCAYGHDRTNSHIHEQLAERHFLHAQQVAAGNDPAAALRAISESLLFNPDHEGAIALRASLEGRKEA